MGTPEEEVPHIVELKKKEGMELRVLHSEFPKSMLE